MSVTQLLHAWREGDSQALELLMPLVYENLRKMAGQYMRREQPGQTLNTTALVHEAYLRLCDAEVAWQDRAHFLAVAAITMRRILVDHARASNRLKRGGKVEVVTLHEQLSASQTLDGYGEAEILDLDRALSRLAQQDARKAKLLEMVYFGGMNTAEAATVLSISVATVNRDLQFARAWLGSELQSYARPQ